MIGVVHYSGPCAICELHPEDRHEVERWMRARRGALAIGEEFALTWRAVKQHERQCLPPANDRRNQRRSA